MRYSENVDNSVYISNNCEKRGFMNFAKRISLIIFSLGATALILSMFSVYTLAYKNLVDDRLDYRETLVREVSLSIEHHLKEKINIVKTLSVAPVLKSMVESSNLYYGEMTKAEREDKIQENNARWKNTKAEDSPFIKDYTHNRGAEYLKTQQALFEDEYGEIFLTDKYGALVASTAKLTTFSHSHKYWWKASYNEGKGSVFLDDRGYDDSVKGYVLGLVIPLFEGDEIIGILKANLNIMRGLGNIILNMQTPEIERIQLIRSNGLVLFEENVTPLSKQVSEGVLNHMNPWETGAFVYENQSKKWVVGYAPISITRGEKGIGFGGSAESIDHEKGNTGQEWAVLDFRTFQSIDEELSNLLSSILIIGLILTFGLAFTAYLLGQKTSQPIKELAHKSNKIAAGDFSTSVSINRNDEIGILADSFNKMIENLRKSTTSIKKLNTEIEKRKATEKKLEKAKEIAEKSNRAKSEFLNTMSHELRTPLNGVIGFSEILKSTSTDKNQLDYLDVILTSANHLLEIISDILDLSRIEAGKFELHPEKTDLMDLIEKTASIVQQKAKKKGLELSVDIANNVPRIVEVDSGRLKQILLNLLSNACKFTEQGDVFLRVHPLEQLDGNVKLRFKVTDTGIGIKEEDRERIFDPFQQLDMSITRQYGGTGLGLSIASDLLQKMGSSLQLTSTYGKGSTFSFDVTLPCEEAVKPKEIHDESAPLESLAFKGKKILIAEDDKVNMQYARTALSMFSKGIQIIEAWNGREAYEHYLKHKPDLILMDIVMPEVDGFQATGMIRLQDSEIPIVAMTAKALKADKEDSLEAGMDDYIAKPVSLDQLKRTLKKYLG